MESSKSFLAKTHFCIFVRKNVWGKSKFWEWPTITGAVLQGGGVAAGMCVCFLGASRVQICGLIVVGGVYTERTGKDDCCACSLCLARYWMPSVYEELGGYGV